MRAGPSTETPLAELPRHEHLYDLGLFGATVAEITGWFLYAVFLFYFFPLDALRELAGLNETERKT